MYSYLKNGGFTLLRPDLSYGFSVIECPVKRFFFFCGLLDKKDTVCFFETIPSATCVHRNRNIPFIKREFYEGSVFIQSALVALILACKVTFSILAWNLFSVCLDYFYLFQRNSNCLQLTSNWHRGFIYVTAVSLFCVSVK